MRGGTLIMSQDEVNLDKKKPSFKHLGILRQAISKAHTGNIRYETVENEEIKMNMLLGNLLSDSMTVNGLEKFLTFPCMDCKFGSFENQVGKQNLLTLEKSNFPVIK